MFIDDWAKSQGDKLIMEPIGGFFKNLAGGTWDWLISVLPDMMGYGALLAGGVIIVSSMVGEGGIIKPIAYYSASLIAAVCILL